MMRVKGITVSFNVNFDGDLNRLSTPDLSAYLRYLQKLELETNDVGLIYPINEKRKAIQRVLAYRAL